VSLDPAANPLLAQVAVALGERYTLMRELGRGGMGTVYLGRDVKLGREVAIKVLLPQTRAMIGDERFQREVQVCSKLSHPNIVQLYEADASGEYEYYVMQYVAGESLHQRLEREGALPVDDALRITAQVGDALQHAHEQHVVHRDVKPANILLCAGRALVTDFGIAKNTAASQDAPTLTDTGVAVGTASYMSPEQASGERRVDARSDVYALAAVLYEMLAGEPPFTGPTAQAIVARVMVDAPRSIRTIRPGVPLTIERALEQGLAKVPADRPQSIRAFLELLSRPAPEPTRGRRVLTSPVTWLGLLVVAATAVIVWRATRSNGAPPGTGPTHAPGMVLVPSGSYRVGGGLGRPARTAALAAFYLDSTEVTVAAYTAYLRATGRAAPWRRSPPPDWPATDVLWNEAQSFCAWRGGERLPTEDEWEAATRGPAGNPYPWGSTWQRGRANVAGAADTLQPVGAFPLGRSFSGAVDLIGNAWEWVADSQPATGGGAPMHIIKGGAFNTLPANATAIYRMPYPDDRQHLSLTGFRCARSLTP
jgi:formylglycine-generating enzyme required for sulfatase activity